MSFDAARVAQGLPDPRAPRARQAARVPRQRRQRAEARARDRRDRRLLPHATTPTCTAACYELSLRARPSALRGRAREGRAPSSAPPTRARSSSCATPPRRSTWWRTATARRHVGPGDEVLVTEMEHHSNIVPWQLLCERARRDAARGADRRPRRAACSSDFATLLTPRTRIVAVTHVSNALGTVNPIDEIARAVPARAALPLLVDGAQAVPHQRVDVQALGCDFYAFSGHKLFGPTGIGVLWGRARAARGDAAVPGRRRMIASVTLREDDVRGHPAPLRGRHAGHRRRRRPRRRRSTTSSGLGLDAIARHEREPARLRHARARARCPACASSAPRAHKAAVISFVIDGVHPHDVGTILDHEGVAVRTGHHCAQPLMERFGVPATARASLALYNTRDDVDALVRGLHARARGVRLMSELRELYQSVILDHNKQPAELRRARRARTATPRATTRCAATRSACTWRWTAPWSTTCGFEGNGCAISTASASLMTEAVKGRPVGRGDAAVRGLPRARHPRSARASPTRAGSASSPCSAACASSRCA